MSAQGGSLGGMVGLPILVTLRHSCRHAVRWHFFGELKAAMHLAESLACPRCGGDAPIPGPCDAIYYPTGVAHLHVGACPDAGPDVQRWLDGIGARIK